MRTIFNILAAVTGIYSLLIFIRIIITWFDNSIRGKPVELLDRATEPYLDFWRRNFNLRIGFLDMSPIAAIAFLSLLQTLFSTFAFYGKVSIGSILAVIITSVWSAISFVLWFCVIILVLRLVGYVANADIYNPFWRIVDTISEPILYRINRIIFGKRITGLLKGIIISILALAAISIAGKLLVIFVSKLLLKLPV